jgi:hypothetical protein
MRMVLRTTLIAAGLAGLVAAPAYAGKLTLGSDLKASANVTLAQGADTAYWASRVAGKVLTVPANGQVVQVRIKGSAIREAGATNDPATMVHFQSLEPAADKGSRKVFLPSAPAYMPVDDPGAISVFNPENLCVHKGGAVAFNTIGGFMWGGSLDAPLNENQYHQGTPWRIFASSSKATTEWYSKDNGTKNGHTLTPHGGTTAREGYGATMRGRELLMQVVVATGKDRSEPCGGPRRHPDGTLVAPKKHELRVAGGAEQRPYVTKDRRFSTGVYCETPGDTCTGKAILKIDGEVVDEVDDLSVPTQSSFKVPMRLDPANFRTLDRQGFLRVTYVLVSQFGTKSISLSLNRN